MAAERKPALNWCALIFDVIVIVAVAVTRLWWLIPLLFLSGGYVIREDSDGR